MGKSIVSLIASEILSIKENILSEKKEDMKNGVLRNKEYINHFFDEINKHKYDKINK